MKAVQFVQDGKKILKAECVSLENMARLSIWCGGEIERWDHEPEDIIVVSLTNGENAFVGEWICEVDGGGFVRFPNPVYQNILMIKDHHLAFVKLLNIMTDFMDKYGPENPTADDTYFLESKAIAALDVIVNNYYTY